MHMELLYMPGGRPRIRKSALRKGVGGKIEPVFRCLNCPTITNPTCNCLKIIYLFALTAIWLRFRLQVPLHREKPTAGKATQVQRPRACVAVRLQLLPYILTEYPFFTHGHR